MERVTAVFTDRKSAQEAVERLRSMGIADSRLSIVGQHSDEMTDKTESDLETMTNKDVTAGATRGLTVGASAGALFGIAAALIPGVGPIITAGVLASSLGAVAGGAVAGAVVGGTAGTLAGAFAQAGYENDEAEYYGNTVQSGGYLVAVDAYDAAEADQVRQVLNSASARYYDASSRSGTGSMSGTGMTR